jgi:hypothetical protein
LIGACSILLANEQELLQTKKRSDSPERESLSEENYVGRFNHSLCSDGVMLKFTFLKIDLGVDKSEVRFEP